MTDTLLTKILLGTFGCAPAYDTYFRMALRKYGFQDSFNKEEFKKLINSITSWDRINQMVKTINRNQGDISTEEYQNRFSETIEKVSDVNRAALAEYVVHRRIILNLFKRGLIKKAALLIEEPLQFLYITH